MKIHLIHGIHTAETNGTVQHLEPYVEEATGLDVVYHPYGYVLGITTRLMNPSRASKIAEKIEDGDICIGHSNGCALIYRIMQMKNISGAVLINAALEKDIAFPNSLLKWVHVYYNKDDGAVPLTEVPIIRRVFLDQYWGEMGKTGYQGKTDPRVVNIDCGSGCPPVSGHSTIFGPEHLPDWGQFIGTMIKNELNSG